MHTNKKTIVKEIGLWKKRFHDSKKVMRGIIKDVSKDVNAMTKDVKAMTKDVKKVAASAIK